MTFLQAIDKLEASLKELSVAQSSFASQLASQAASSSLGSNATAGAANGSLDAHTLEAVRTSIATAHETTSKLITTIQVGPLVRCKEGVYLKSINRRLK
jgi:hypothetical protein